ncbi:hypothetical protein DFH06DRAFT_1388497 [Mycena polygramma]|nr:hypothetical protein DFH06DRAFT_1388497 [Mycena polygramma]
MTHPLVVHSPSALPPRLVSAATGSAHSGAHAAENVRARQRARHSRQHALCAQKWSGAPSASDWFREERRLPALLERVGVTTHCGRARDPLPSRNWERTRRRFYAHGSTSAMTTQAAPNAPRRNPQAISSRVEPRASSRARRAARRRKVSTDPPPKAGGPFECRAREATLLGRPPRLVPALSALLRAPPSPSALRARSPAHGPRGQPASRALKWRRVGERGSRPRWASNRARSACLRRAACRPSGSARVCISRGAQIRRQRLEPAQRTSRESSSWRCSSHRRADSLPS